eukprot:CAMPEP_0113463330 /NCGR_PEP_ID=MMETSP0014_2-20120614/12585_1 /TAXON_ID=2857 /ORGANISM="Nitzschia sp." /LENGTH=668 /DNA_ID=CAMNT_0000355287 /DNA_START=288 /DNA_END=2294 /DNA_ORIENTATION=+ /assembly_acc=CAM_ASM_000159
MASAGGGAGGGANIAANKITIPSLEGVVPLTDIEDPKDVDVLCGRSGSSQRHVGTQQFRTLVNLNKGLYVTCMKSEKVRISRSIVSAIREQKGRFLERDGEHGKWYDIGDKKAIEKTSQALRENQPKLRKKIMESGLPTSAMPNSSTSSSNVAQIPVIPSTQALRSQQSMVSGTRPAGSLSRSISNQHTASPPLPPQTRHASTGTKISYNGTGGAGTVADAGGGGGKAISSSSPVMFSIQQQNQQQFQMFQQQQQQIEQQQQEMLMKRALMYQSNVMSQQRSQQQTTQHSHMNQVHGRQDLLSMASNRAGSGSGSDNINDLLLLQQRLNLSSQNQQQIPNNNAATGGLRDVNQRQHSFTSNMSNLSDGAPIPYNPSQQQNGDYQQRLRALGQRYCQGHRQDYQDSTAALGAKISRSDDGRRGGNSQGFSPTRRRGGGTSLSTGSSSDKTTGSPKTVNSLGMSVCSASINSDIFSESNSSSTPPPPLAGPGNAAITGQILGNAFADPAYQNQQRQPSRVDRRRLFAKMKISDPGVTEGHSGMANDWVPNINMVDSQRSFFSNFSNPKSQAQYGGGGGGGGVDAATVGSRRSLMSGLSKIDDPCDMQSIFSDMSKRVGHISSSRSVAMSEFSGIDDGSRMAGTRSVAMSEFSGIDDASRMTGTDTFSLAS